MEVDDVRNMIVKIQLNLEVYVNPTEVDEYVQYIIVKKANK